jgi:hypothetical protein
LEFYLDAKNRHSASHLPGERAGGRAVILILDAMNLFDIANLLDNDGNLQNEMMVFAFAATLLSTIPGRSFTI